MKAVFDTNILLDYLNGVEAAKVEIFRFTTRCISVITQVEVLVGAGDPEEEKLLRGFLSGFQICELTTEIADEAVRVRQKHRLNVPDAIIYATARVKSCLFVTRNTKDFDPEWPDVRAPYRV